MPKISWLSGALPPPTKPFDSGVRPSARVRPCSSAPPRTDGRHVVPGRTVRQQSGDVGTYNRLWSDRGSQPGSATSLIVDPPDGRFPLTEETRERIAAQREYRRAHPANSWLDRSNWDRCITYHGMLPISTGYNNTYQIFQAPGYVAILVENIHDVRIIPVDGRPRLDDDIRQWNGDSRGH